MSVSSARRYSELASSTPAMKAPSAIDSPAKLISSAMPTTSSSANAVNTSRTSAFATIRSTGLTRKRPATMTATIAPIAISAFSQTGSALVACLPRPSSCATSGTTAISGIAAMSWKRRIAKPVRPAGVAVMLRSAITCVPIAVDDIASAKPAINADGHASPSAISPADSSAPVNPSCALPPMKTAPRSFHSSSRSSSSPIRNSISTTPNSETWPMLSTFEINPHPHGPMTHPAIR